MFIYYSAIRNNKILPFTTTIVDVVGIILSEISQIEEAKSYMIPLICGI